LGYYSHAANYNTIAQGIYQTAIGRYNVAQGNFQNATSNDAAFIIGNGGADARSNAFRVTWKGNVYAEGNYNSSGADYAEMFEWLDGNPGDEDRTGYFVTPEQGKIRKATDTDTYILGVVSAAPSIVGDSDGAAWHGMYLRDDFGRAIYETVDVEQEVPDDDEAKIKKWHEANDAYEEALKQDLEDGEPEPEKPAMPTKKVTLSVQRPKLDPAYDPELPYTPRDQRKEWAAIGMMGKLIVRDDGTCTQDGFCSVSADGTATDSASGYFVLERLDANTVKIIVKG